jgi:hypothetical protein
MKHIDCPICGFPNPVNRKICEFCDVSLKEALLEDPELIPCPTCEGTGSIVLNYKDSCAKNPEDQWLPCADCGGAGRKALPDIRASVMKKGAPGIIDLISNLLEIFSK